MSKLHFVGTCVNSFDEEGDCIIAALPYQDVSDFGCSLENAIEIGVYEFQNKVVVPSDLELVGESFTYLEDQNVLMAYNEDTDIHYFFA